MRQALRDTCWFMLAFLVGGVATVAILNSSPKCKPAEPVPHPDCALQVRHLTLEVEKLRSEVAALRHIVSECPHCRRRFEDWERFGVVRPRRGTGTGQGEVK